MIEQAKNSYTWSVTYADGTVVREYDRPEGCGFAEVDAARVTQIRLEGGTTQHVVSLPDGAMPVFFRRHSIDIALSDGRQTARPVVHCVGWKSEQHAVYLFLFPDGRTLLSSNLQAV